MTKHDEMHQTDVFYFYFLFFFRFHWSFFLLMLMLCVTAANAVCLKYTRSVAPLLAVYSSHTGKWKGSELLFQKQEARTRRKRGKKEAHHIIILSWRPTKISGFKTCFSEIFLCLFCFSGGKKTNSVFHSSDVVFFFASFWRLRSDRHIAQSLFATIYVTWF